MLRSVKSRPRALPPFLIAPTLNGSFNMRLHQKFAFTEWGFIALLAVLCSVLTILQHQWTGEISRAEAERLRGSVQADAEAFAKSFDGTLTSYCTTLVPTARHRDPQGRAEMHLKCFEKWRARKPRPIFSHVAVAVPNGGTVALYEQSLTDGSLVPTNWPANWESLRSHFEQRRFGPATEGGGILFEVPLFSDSADDFDGPPEIEWVIFELDTNYLQSVWFPQLMKQYVNVYGNQLYQAVVKNLGSPVKKIYATAEQIEASVKPIVVPLNRQGRARTVKMGPSPNAVWTLSIYPQPDALEELVARSRHKNFAVALFLNALILVAGLALVRHTRRSRELAQQQMNFVAGVSHELRTPLTVIRGAAHNLNRGVVSERAQIEKYSGLIIAHVEQLGDMVEQVLTLAGVQNKNAATLRQPVALPEVLRDAVAASTHDVQVAHCELQLELPPALPEILGDASSLRRCFQNLISNAAKHGGSGKWIGVSAAIDEDQQPPVVVIEVADRGSGIPAYELAEIFKPFFRGTRPQSSQVRGSGLGLSLVKEIVEAHGGTISVRSAENHGSTFTVCLPVSKKEKSK